MMNPQHQNEKPPRPYWGPMATVFFGILIAIVFMIVQTVVIGIFTAIEAASNQGADIHKIVEGLTNSGFVLSIGSFATTLMCVPIIFLIIRIKQGLTIKEYLGIRIVRIKEILPWFAAISVTLICYDLSNLTIGRPIVPEFMTVAYRTAKFQPLFWFALIALAPVSEEFFFRGFLFKGFKSTFLRPIGTILLTSFLWAIIHTQYDYYDITFVFIIGIILGTARVKSKSVLTTVYLHGFMNLVATIETAIVVS
jgi:membrane protease YdiL (CAAX protease family)